MSFTSTTEASYEEKDLEESIRDQRAKYQEKSASPIRTQTTSNENLVESEAQDIKDQFGEQLTKSEDYQACIARQEQIFNTYSEKDTTAISSNISDSGLEPNSHLMYREYIACSDLFKCEYCSVRQDSWVLSIISILLSPKKEESDDYPYTYRIWSRLYFDTP